MGNFKIRSAPTFPVRKHSDARVEVYSGNIALKDVKGALLARLTNNYVHGVGTGYTLDEIVRAIESEDITIYVTSGYDGGVELELGVKLPESDYAYNIRTEQYDEALTEYNIWREANKDEIAAELKRREALRSTAALEKKLKRKENALKQIERLTKEISRLDDEVRL